MRQRGDIDPRLVYAVAVAGTLLSIGAAMQLGGDASERALLAARYTARAAFLAFVPVYVVGPLARLMPASGFARLIRLRRHLGLAFALVMAAHVVALSINIGLYRPRPLAALVPGSIVFALALAMALTSTDRARRRLGDWWGRLHLAGQTAILIGFAHGYIARLFHPGYAATGAVFTPLLVAMVGLRLYDAVVRRRTVRAAG